MKLKSSVSVVVLTYNEEANIEDCLKSVQGWSDDILIIDSYSDDTTVEVARNYTDKIYSHKFKHWATQRNWALENLPFKYDWILFLDADERVSEELKEKIQNTLPNVGLNTNGFYINRKFFFMGRWIKHGGYYPYKVLRLVKHKFASYIKHGAWEYGKIDGTTSYIDGYIIHEDNRDIDYWIDKHNKFASIEAKEFNLSNSNLSSEGELEGKRRIVINSFLNKLPFMFRPFIRFIYRYFFRLGFLDGKEGLIYFFLHDFWYPFLVDTKIEEMRKKSGAR